MRKRKFSNLYKYGLVLEKESQVFFMDLYKRVEIKNLFSNKKILDLGCGIGAEPIVLSKFAKLVVGVDIIEHKEWEIFKSRKIKFQKASSTKLPFKDNAFDGVYLKDLLHHIKGINKTFEEIKRVTKANGDIVIVEANRYNPIFYVYVTTLKGHDHFTQNEFKDLIKNNFPNSKFIYLEAYPPFRFPMKVYKFIQKIEKKINRIHFLRSIFCYNVAIIKNIK